MRGRHAPENPGVGTELAVCAELKHRSHRTACSGCQGKFASGDHLWSQGQELEEGVSWAAIASERIAARRLSSTASNPKSSLPRVGYARREPASKQAVTNWRRC
jgi:hypothetical protein